MDPQPLGSTERPDTLVGRASDLILAIDPARIRGAWAAGEPTEIALVLDGTVQAIFPAAAHGFEWAVPPHVFGRLLDVVSTATGASLLNGPTDLSAIRPVRWKGWALGPGGVAGAFDALGTDAAALPIAFIADGHRHASGFARRRYGNEFVFKLPLTRLPIGTGGLALQPMVGSLLLPPVLHVPAEAFRHVGMLESAEPWRIRGWAAERASDGVVPLELRVDGVLAHRFVAERPREDVGALGFGDHAGFDEAVPAPLDRAVSIDVRIVGGPSLGGSPFVRPAAPRYVGYFDGVDGFSGGGWAIDIAATDVPVQIDLLCDGQIVGSGRADLHRGDVLEAGLPSGRCGFHVLLDRPAGALVGRKVVASIAGTGLALAGSPRTVVLNPNVAAFLERKRPNPAVLTRLRRRLTHRAGGTTVSIVMPVHETREDWLRQAIASVTAQWSDNWELICVDDGSRAPHVGAILQAAAADPRITIIHRLECGGIARAVNDGIQAARGDYIAVLDHDDALEPDAVFHLADAAQATGAGLLYSDEVLTGPSLDQVIQHRARPAWSHDYYLSHPYFVHLVAVRRSLALAVGGWDETMSISADVDFVLRVVERASAVAHIPRALYRWRTHPDSTGHRQRGAVMAATQAAIGRHLVRTNRAASVSAGQGFNQFRLDWPDDGGEVLIVIPTRDRVHLLRHCIDSIAATAAGERYRIVVVDHHSTDPATLAYLAELPHAVLPYDGPFNFAAMNNAAIRTHGGTAPYLLFLNNDVEAIDSGWLPRLRSLTSRPEVGAVGPMLLYGNGRVQHAGVIVGFGGTADHAMRFAEPTSPGGVSNPGYNASLTSLRDFSAVTAACLMMRRSVFDQVGGFDEAFAVGFNDTDLCLRLRQAGLAVLYDGHTKLRHYESATRAADKALADPTDDDRRLQTRWPDFFTGTDPYYNPWLALDGTDHRLRTDRGWHGRLTPRVVRATHNL